VKLELAPRAVREAEHHARGGARTDLEPASSSKEERRVALEQIRFSPEVGAVNDALPSREYRRLRMPRTRYHDYYRLTEPDRIRVVSIWSAVRGRAPALR
jgi:hypothetical protein